MRAKFTEAAKRIRARLTRRAVVWFVKTNVQSWLIQGTLWGVLTLAGVSAVAAVVVAKTSAYTVWIGQCVRAARS